VQTRNRAFALIIGLLIAVAITSGVIYAGGMMNDAAPNNPPQGGDELNGTSWHLVSIDGTAAIVGRNPASIAFAEGKATGSTGCNRMFGSYILLDGVLSFKGVGSTRMACSPELNQQEMHFLNALSAVEGYTLSDDSLTISFDGGKQLVFAKAAA
jgi:heat shock protein HslJ